MENIEIDRLIPNPLNPRKELGDLTELTASIKANGILQNLSVVKMDGHHVVDPTTGETDGFNYMVVIGHRRLAAAEKAGLKEVPCEVLELTEAEQVAMMLAENMQRNNLTKFEETAGIQQALDLGLSESDIAEKTGFTKQTITKHKKAMEVGADVVKKGYQAGATIDQLIDLSKIKDEKARNKLAESLGTYSFEYNLEAALKKQAWEPTKQKIIEALKDKLQAKPGKKRWCEGKVIRSVKDIVVPKKLTDKYFYYSGDVGSVDLYKGEEKKQSNTSSNQKKDKEKEQKSKEREDAFNIAYSCRFKFVEDYLKNNNKLDDELLKLFIESVANGDISGTHNNLFKKLTGGKDESSYFMKEKSIQNMIVAASYASLDYENQKICSYYDGSYDSDDTENVLLYKILKMIGYLLSDVEQSMLDGNWELFEK